MILVIDNYDSFTYNLVQYFQCLRQDVLTVPHDKISLGEIEVSSSFAKDLKFLVCGDSKYKISQIGVLIDGKEVEIKDSKWIGSKKFEAPVSVDIANYSDGEHKLEVYAIDSSFNKNKSSQTNV